MITKMRKTVQAPESAGMCPWSPCRQVAMVGGSGFLVLVHGMSLRPGAVPGTCMAAQMTEGLHWLQELPPLEIQRKMHGVSWRSSGKEALLGSGWETEWPGDVSCVLQNTGHRRCREQHPHSRLSPESLGPGGPTARGLRREVISQSEKLGEGSQGQPFLPRLTRPLAALFPPPSDSRFSCQGEPSRAPW